MLSPNHRCQRGCSSRHNGHISRPQKPVHQPQRDPQGKRAPHESRPGRTRCCSHPPYTALVILLVQGELQRDTGLSRAHAQETSQEQKHHQHHCFLRYIAFSLKTFEVIFKHCTSIAAAAVIMLISKAEHSGAGSSDDDDDDDDDDEKQQSRLLESEQR